jgi:hypothetical protein
MDLAQWIVDFKVKYPEFAVIKNSDDEDITNTILTQYVDLAMNLLPQGAVSYFTRERLVLVVDYMVCHLLQYFDILNNYEQVKSLLRATSSMSANGLSLSYSEVARLRGDMFNTLNEFLNTTAYGKMVTIWLNQMAGSAGGYLV